MIGFTNDVKFLFDVVSHNIIVERGERKIALLFKVDREISPFSLRPYPLNVVRRILIDARMRVRDGVQKELRS